MQYHNYIVINDPNISILKSFSTQVIAIPVTHHYVEITDSVSSEGSPSAGSSSISICC